MTAALLPPNASPFERAMAETLARLLTIAVPLRALWSADDCPASLLPWLAWTLSVDEWDRAWPEGRKRDVIRAALDLHRIKGSRASIDRALAALGYPDAVVLEGTGGILYDGSALYEGAETYGSTGHWAEYRIFLSHPLTVEQEEMIRRALARVAPVRCHLAEFRYPLVEHLYDGEHRYDDTIQYE